MPPRAIGACSTYRPNVADGGTEDFSWVVELSPTRCDSLRLRDSIRLLVSVSSRSLEELNRPPVAPEVEIGESSVGGEVGAEDSLRVVVIIGGEARRGAEAEVERGELLVGRDERVGGEDALVGGEPGHE